VNGTNDISLGIAAIQTPRFSCLRYLLLKGATISCIFDNEIGTVKDERKETGSIPTKEAEMMAEALSSSDAGIEVC